MNSVLLSIKTDSETKEQLKSFAAELGISSTAFVNLLVKQAIRNRQITLSAPLEPTPYLEKIIRKADSDYKAGRDITHTTTRAETLAHLDSLMKK